MENLYSLDRINSIYYTELVGRSSFLRVTVFVPSTSLLNIELLGRLSPR